jgi:hypothetical protein
MMDAFLQWKYPMANMQPPPTTSTPALSPVNTGEALAHGGPPATVESYDFTINTIDVFSLNTTATIKRSESSKSVAVALVLQGFIGSSPEQPTLAVSLKTLELFRRIRMRKASFSVEAFAKVICDLYSVRNIFLKTCFVLIMFLLTSGHISVEYATHSLMPSMPTSLFNVNLIDWLPKFWVRLAKIGEF